MSWLFLIVASIVAAEDILVLVESSDIKESHSAYFEKISAAGHRLIYKSPDSQGLRLDKYEEYLYSTVILICPTTEDLIGKVSVSELVKFSDNGGNLIVFGDTDAAAHYRKLANEFGVDFYEQGTRVYSDSKSKVLSLSKLQTPDSIYKESKKPLTLSGIALHYNQDSKLLTPILVTPSGFIVRNEFKKTDNKQSVALGVVFQGRNNARTVFLGSVDVCSNNYTTVDSNSNLDFCVEVTKWGMQTKSVLRYSGITHHKQAEKKDKGYLQIEYTVNDDLTYSVDIEELKDGKWVPHNTKKAYVEFVMLDPKVRKYLKSDGNSLVTKFRAPDVHGVYQFKVFLKDPGYSWIETSTKAIVRPYRHNEFERFLTCAFPYYASIFSSMSGFLIFSFLFLYHKSS